MAAIAIIPARGGSKRIPKKNIMDFCGKPMIAWTIDAAIKSEKFERIIVSTDDQNIADTAIQFGAEVPFLREKYSDDITPVSEATLFALSQAELYYQEEYETVAQLMANCPLRGEQAIQSSIESFANSGSHFSISAFKFGWMNPWWAAKIDKQGVPTPMFPEALTQRSQDLSELYCPTGAIWLANVDAIKNSQTFYGDDYRFTPISWVDALDIDDYDDLAMAKALAMNLGRQRPSDE